jgi:hypothetical protein
MCQGARLNGRDAHGRQSRDAAAEAPKLADLDISTSQASRWQQPAPVPKARFEAALALGSGRQ